MSSSIIQNIINKAKKNPKKIVFPEGEEPRILKASDKILEQKIAKIILIGNKDEINSKITKLKLKNLKNVEIHDPTTSKNTDKYAEILYNERKHKGMDKETAKKTSLNSIYFATLMVHSGDADGLVGGATTTTADTLRPALQIIKTNKKFKKASSFFIMVLKNKPLFFADCALEINPDAKDLADIAIDTATTTKKFGYTPKIAMLSFSTKGSAKHPSVDKVREATAIVKDTLKDVVVDGELQVDAALVPLIAKQKAPNSKIQGDANILIFPSLSCGNIAYKLVERLAKAKAIGPIIQGLNKPVNDLSRGCNIDDIINVTAITVIESQDK
jgi:phosphate acetyltransferase